MLQYKIPKSKTILHSIPIGSIMVLLLFSLCLLNPQLFSSSSAAYATENNNVSNSINNASTSTNDTESSTSLIIGGAEMNEVVDASVGEVAYRKHTVTISASKLKSYTLFISGPEGLNGETTITGANGNTPTDMPKNSWGYAYGQDGSENNMTYSSFTNNAELIDSKLESESTTEDTDFTKNLIFAVKFGNAIAGHYTGTVTLSLAAEPKEVVLPTNPVETWDELKSMQQMTSKACASIGTAGSGTYPSKTLVDSRDGNEYTITKLDDQNCWMTQNLRITGDSIKAKDPSNTNGTITSADSNVSSNYNIPASSSPWPSSDNTRQSVHYANNTTNGAYYSWCAATAGTCVDSGEAKGSICPRGWKLPSNTEYSTLLTSAGIGNNGSKLNSAPYNFPYAGYVGSGFLRDVGSWGYYWSSTANGTDFAYYLGFGSSSVGTGGNGRYGGFSVRCIAMNAEDEKEQEEAIKNTPIDNWTDVEYMQQMSPQACAQATTATSSNYNTVKKTLKDSRDNSTYDVAKLDDGKCWMTQNLRIVNKAIDSTDSNLAEGATYAIPPSSIYGWGSSDADAQDVLYKNETNGAYYTYCVATAGTCVSSGAASGSICPKGWKLPTRAEYDNFLSKAGISNNGGKLNGSPYNFPYAGYIDDDAILKNAGSEGHYWSSTANVGITAYRLLFYSSGASTNPGYRFEGFSVRCIAQE